MALSRRCSTDSGGAGDRLARGVPERDPERFFFVLFFFLLPPLDLVLCGLVACGEARLLCRCDGDRLLRGVDRLLPRC